MLKFENVNESSEKILVTIINVFLNANEIAFFTASIYYEKVRKFNENKA